jgi:hypothetical protein
MQARLSTPSSLAAHHRRLIASCAESGCPQVRQRSDAKSSARTVGESLCMSKSVEAHYKGPDSERQGPTNRMSVAMFSGSPHSTRATMSDRPSAKSHQKQPTKRPNAKVNAVSQHQDDQPFREMQHGRHRRHCSPGHHRTLPPWRDDHAATGRPTQRLRNPMDGRSAQRSERRRLRLSDQWRAQSPRRHGRRLSWD